MSTVCDVHGAYHFFAVPTGEGGYGRQCACGTPQVYRPPTGSESAKFSDVLVDAEDLRILLAFLNKDRHSAYVYDVDESAALRRVNALLD